MTLSLENNPYQSSEEYPNIIVEIRTDVQQAASLIYHFDLCTHQYVNMALPHRVFLHLDCPTAPYNQSGSFTHLSSNSSADKGQQIPVNLPFDRAGEKGLGGGATAGKGRVDRSTPALKPLTDRYRGVICRGTSYSNYLRQHPCRWSTGYGLGVQQCNADDLKN